MSELAPSADQLPEVELYDTLLAALRAEGTYPDDGDGHEIARKGEEPETRLQLTDYMSQSCVGYNRGARQESRERLLHAGKSILSLHVRSALGSCVYVIGYKNDVDLTHGEAEHIVDDAQDYIPDDPTEMPFIYYQGADGGLVTDIGDHPLLLEAFSAFSSQHSQEYFALTAEE